MGTAFIIINWWKLFGKEKLVAFGILNGRKLINVIGERIGSSVNLQDFVENATVGEIISEMGDDYYYMLADKKLTIDAAMNNFENNRKLLIILITKHTNGQFRFIL